MTGLVLASLAVAIIVLIIVADALHAALLLLRTEIADLDAENAGLRYRLERALFEVATLKAANEDANAQIAGMLERPGVTCPCAELLTNRDRIAYLKGRNEKLTTDALGNNAAQYIKLNKN